MTPNVELHIGELVLEGFAPADRDRIGAAVRLELTRLLIERGVPATWRTGAEAASVDAGSISLPTQCGPEATGARVATAVFGGLRS